MKKTRAIFQPLTPFKNMMNYRLLLIPRLFIALLLTPLCVTGVLAQEADSGQAEEGTTSDRKPGITVIVDAAGAVQIIDKPGAAPRPATKGDQIPVEGTVVTGADGRADLALSNGAFFQILENSKFSIESFEQSPFEVVFADGALINKKDVEEYKVAETVMPNLEATNDSWNSLPSEPSTSKTSLKLDYGAMIGESKKLKQGSVMQISTPVGSAGIRGTVWSFSQKPVGGKDSNQFQGSLAVAEGRVDFLSPDNSRSVQVKSGFSTNIQATMQSGGELKYNSFNSNVMTPEGKEMLITATEEVAGQQSAFTAAQGSPQVLLNVLKTVDNVDPNNPQAVADAALSAMGTEPAIARQVSQVVSAFAVTQSNESELEGVISELTSALCTQSPNLAADVAAGIVATSATVAEDPPNL
jgi:hypothetical protein